MICPRCNDARHVAPVTPIAGGLVVQEAWQPCPDCTPVRLQLSRRRGFSLQAVSRAVNGLPAIVVARPSTWGNPYRLGAPKHHIDGRTVTPATAVEAVIWYRDWLEFHLRRDNGTATAMRHALEKHLRGKNLACWCPLDAPCHADVLLELANRPGAGAGA